VSVSQKEGVYDFLWFRHANAAEANYTSAADSAPNELNLSGLDSGSLKTFARRNLQVEFFVLTKLVAHE
jgi:hypothetical protein